MESPTDRHPRKSSQTAVMQAEMFAKACVLDGSVWTRLDHDEGQVELDRKDARRDEITGLAVHYDLIEDLLQRSLGVVDSWSQATFTSEWARLMSIFFIQFVPWDDPFTDVEGRWIRYLMVRGFLSPFHPRKGLFSPSQGRLFVLEEWPLVKKLSGDGQDEDVVQFRLFMDGNAWCAAMEPFVNMMESPTAFGDTAMEATMALLGDRDVREIVQRMKDQAAGLLQKSHPSSSD